MHRNRTTVLTVLTAAGLSLACATAVTASSGTAAAAASVPTVLRVVPGQSVQAAIDRARPGDTIDVASGVYEENLTIRTNDITLRGAAGTVLRMPATPRPSACTEDGGVNGLCIAGVFVLGSDEVGAPGHGVHVSGFQLRDFTRFGVLAYNAEDVSVTDTDVAGSSLWGFAAFTVSS